MSKTNSFRKQEASGWRKGQCQKDCRKHSAAVTGVVEMGIVGPEGRIEELILELCRSSEHEAAAEVRSIGIPQKIEVSSLIGAVELNRGDLPRDMSHVIASERAIDPAKMAGIALLEVEKQAGGFHAAGRQDGSTSDDRSGPGRRDYPRLSTRLPSVERWIPARVVLSAMRILLERRSLSRTIKMMRGLIVQRSRQSTAIPSLRLRA